jgi:hypothetical protein
MKEFAVALFCAGLAVASSAPALASQGTPQADAPASITINDPKEREAFQAIRAATTPAAALAAAKAALTAYPGSAGKPAAEADLYNALIDAIAASPGGTGTAEHVAMAKEFDALFPGSELSLKLRRSLINYNIAQKNFAEVMTTGEAYLAKHPDHAATHQLLLEISIDALKNNDQSHLSKGLAHGKRALALFEANTKPAEVTDADWAELKSSKEWYANQLVGLVALQSGDRAGGTEYLQKSIALNPKDPLNYFYLAVSREMTGDDIAKKFNALADKKSAEGQKLLEDAKANEDAVIDLLVKSVAAAGSDPKYAAVVGQARPSLEAHYKNRHNGSLAGLDEKIKAAAPAP